MLAILAGGRHAFRTSPRMKPEAALSTNQADHGLAVQRGAISLSPYTTEAATMVQKAFITGHPVKHFAFAPRPSSLARYVWHSGIL